MSKCVRARILQRSLRPLNSLDLGYGMEGKGRKGRGKEGKGGTEEGRGGKGRGRSNPKQKSWLYGPNLSPVYSKSSATQEKNAPDIYTTVIILLRRRGQQKTNSE